jgi:hypothetical protein
MDNVVFLRVRQTSKFGQSLHAPSIGLTRAFSNPDQNPFHGVPEQLRIF